jgi:ABC-2 type transport system ATP-binding protein
MTRHHRFRSVMGMYTALDQSPQTVVNEDTPAGTDTAIEVTGLTMRYGPRQVVNGIDFTVNHGEVFAFLGPNGAGKTTTVEILEGFRSRTAGTVRVLGIDPESAPSAWRDRVGVVLQSSVPEPDLTVEETVELYAGFYRRPRPVDEVLALTGLEAQAGMRNRRLSGGQQRRLDVALALVGDPDVLFLDEPTTGFDPAARRAAWETIAGLKRLGKTIFLTTHYLEEAEYLADRIAVITAGRIVATGTPADLGGRDQQPSTVRLALHPSIPFNEWPAEFAAGAGVAARLRPRPRPRLLADGRFEFDSSDPAADLYELTRWATTNGVRIDGLEVTRPTLEDVYLALTDEREAQQ